MEDEDIPMSVAIGVISGILSGVTVALSSGSKNIKISTELGGIVAGVATLTMVFLIVVNNLFKIPRKKKLTKEDIFVLVLSIILAILLFLTYIYDLQKIFWLIVGIFIGIGLFKFFKNRLN